MFFMLIRWALVFFLFVFFFQLYIFMISCITILGHTHPSDDRVNTNACSATQSPYISFCDFDGAGRALQASCFLIVA